MLSNECSSAYWCLSLLGKLKKCMVIFSCQKTHVLNLPNWESTAHRFRCVSARDGQLPIFSSSSKALYK